MIHQLYVIFDKVAERTLGPLVQFPGDAAAVRFFRDLVEGNGGAQDISKHPGDFELHRVGTFEDETETLQGDAAQVVVTGAALVAASSRSEA